MQLTGGRPSDDIPIPGETFTFGALVRAQAIGDYLSLVSRNRRLASINLGSDVERGLETLAETVRAVILSRKDGEGSRVAQAEIPR